jgi:DNA ligase D-like protein (predicted ligase)
MSINTAALPTATARFIEPMRCQLVASLPEGPDWQYEIKWDGYRATAVRTAARTELYSRNGNALTARFRHIASALNTVPADSVLDGEIVALDERGHPSFTLLQQVPTSTPVLFYAFDLPVFRGASLTALPLRDRRELLRQALRHATDPIRISESFDGRARDLIAQARRQGLEGIVAKRASSTYQPGKRTGAWVKYKTARGQELVIGGYLPGPHGFDALLVGYYEGPGLMFVAKIRSGFVPETRQRLAARFPPLEIPDCPFANLPERRSARRGLALTAEAMRQCRWLRPKLVAHIEFTEWTPGNHLRHARFAALRDDKHPRDVTRESPASPVLIATKTPRPAGADTMRRSRGKRTRDKKLTTTTRPARPVSGFVGERKAGRPPAFLSRP